MPMLRNLLWSIVLGLGLCVSVSSARAEDNSDGACPEEEGEGGAPKVEVIRGAGGEQIVRIKQAFCIEGRIQKPNVFYVLERSSIGYKLNEMNQNFMPRILRSVERAPF